MTATEKVRMIAVATFLVSGAVIVGTKVTKDGLIGFLKGAEDTIVEAMKSTAVKAISS